MMMRVKPMQWLSTAVHSYALGAGAEYLVELSHNGSWYYEDQRHGSAEDAMKAAQADYERRILSAIEIVEDNA